MRALNEREIEYVLQDIKPINNMDKSISLHIFNGIRDKFKSLLAGKQIYPEMIDVLRKEITKQYYSSQVQPGESVGILSAQSNGERQTQMTLNTFHSAGIASATVVTGVPRFNELVNATKNPKNVITNIYLNKEYNTIAEIRESSGIQIKHVTFGDVLKSYSICKNKKLDYWYDFFDILYPSDRYYTHRIRCVFDLNILYLYKLELSSIAHIICNAYSDLQCVWSPNSIGIIDIWFDSDAIVLPEYIRFPIQKCDRIDIYVDDVVIHNLKQLSVNGIPGIDQVYYRRDAKQKLYIEAAGFNLPDLLALDIVDETQTISNNMWEIYNTLGVEATRDFLIEEFMNVVSMDSYINKRHIQLIVDVMLYTGSISSISRYGVHRNQSGVLTKCSFEESLEQILKAGVYGEKENITGVSAAIICGKLSNTGSGMCELVYNQ